jgi:protein TonB
MAFRLNIIISIIFHVTLVLVVVALNSRDTLFRLPSDHMTVALLKEFTEIKSRSNQETKAEKRTIHVPVLKTTVFENPKRPAITEENKIISRTSHIDTSVPISGDETDEKRAKTETLSKTDEIAAEEGNEFAEQSQIAIQNSIYGGSKENQATAISQPPVLAKGIIAGEGTENRAINTVPKVSGNFAAIGSIRDAIEKAKHYPSLAKKRGIEGTVTTVFKINKKGYPEDIKIIQSSGSDILDSAAKKTVIKASPFPVVKKIVEIPISFRLKNNE